MARTNMLTRTEQCGPPDGPLRLAAHNVLLFSRPGTSVNDRKGAAHAFPALHQACRMGAARRWRCCVLAPTSTPLRGPCDANKVLKRRSRSVRSLIRHCTVLKVDVVDTSP